MTATRIRRAGTVVLLAAGWLVAAALLWRTSVPHLDLPRLDEHALFTARRLRATADFDRFERVTFVLAALAQLTALAVVARRGPSLTRGLGIGRVGSGIVVGMVTLLAFWAAGLPFTLADAWWQRRHGLTKQGYVAFVLEPWSQLLVGALLALLAIAVVMGLAGRFRRWWWLPTAGVFTAIAALLAFVSPYLVALDLHRPKPRLRAAARELERRERLGHVPLGVQKMRDKTTQANAFTVGFGPTQRVVVWDTLLDGRFTPREVRFVVAHELGHVKRRHILKGLGWFALFALPGSLVLAEVTRRRGTMADPAVVPLGALVFVALQLVLLPVTNVVSRRYEAEADWIALQATRDPRAGAKLFAAFARTSLEQPRPPWWAYVLLHNHPTIMQRIEMTRAWGLRNRSEAASRGGSGSP